MMKVINLPIFFFSQTYRGKYQGLCNHVYILDDNRILLEIMARHLEDTMQIHVNSPHRTKT